MEHRATLMNAAAIAQHLQVEATKIKEVRDFKCWNGGEVWLVLFVKGRSRFVSKKAVKMTEQEYEAMWDAAEKEQDDRADKAEAMVAKINDHLPVGHSASWSKLYSAAVDVLEENCTFQEAVDKFTSKKLVIKKGNK